MLTLDFTDQGQTGMSDQSGLVYRLGVDGKLDTLLSNGISPNGLVLSPDQKVHHSPLVRTALISGAICSNDQREQCLETTITRRRDYFQSWKIL